MDCVAAGRRGGRDGREGGGGRMMGEFTTRPSTEGMDGGGGDPRDGWRAQQWVRIRPEFSFMERMEGSHVERDDWEHC